MAEKQPIRRGSKWRYKMRAEVPVAEVVYAGPGHVHWRAVGQTDGRETTGTRSQFLRNFEPVEEAP